MIKMQFFYPGTSPLVLLVLVVMGLFTPVMAQEQTDPLLSALSLAEPVTLCGESVPIENQAVLERFEKEMLIALGNRPQVILWLKRSTRYFPYIDKMLDQNGLPEDLKYLAVAESALRMHAGSPKGAMGLWQLMPETARKYGLTVNGSFDERRNIYLSTPAAMVYLKGLFEHFGSWSLAMAGYNMGEEGLKAQVLEQGTTDYYRLYLSLETQRFVLRILAIKRIMEAPEQHGFHLSPDDMYEPETFLAVQIHAFNDIPLRLIADAAQTDFKTIKDFNPELRGHYLNSGTRSINIPVHGEKGFQDRLSNRIETDTRLRNQHVYVVQKGDNLSEIAKKFDVPLVALLIWNRFGIHSIIHPGQQIVIYQGAMESIEQSEQPKVLSNG